MLRIKYRGKESVFEFRGIARRDVPATVTHHRAHWQYEEVVDPATRQKSVRTIPASDLTAEWQDGENWDENAAAEPIPVPGA